MKNRQILGKVLDSVNWSVSVGDVAGDASVRRCLGRLRSVVPLTKEIRNRGDLKRLTRVYLAWITFEPKKEEEKNEGV
jgi:hypothetical protein